MKKVRKNTLNKSGDTANQPLYLDLKEFQALSGLPYRSIEVMLDTKRLPHVVVGKRRLIHRSVLLRLDSFINATPKLSSQEVKHER